MCSFYIYIDVYCIFADVVDIYLLPFVAVYLYPCMPDAVLVEKILRVQPDVHKIYLVVRAIDEASAKQRVQQEVGPCACVYIYIYIYIYITLYASSS
jgi:hypothetical protein